MSRPVDGKRAAALKSIIAPRVDGGSCDSYSQMLHQSDNAVFVVDGAGPLIAKVIGDHSESRVFNQGRIMTTNMSRVHPRSGHRKRPLVAVLRDVLADHAIRLVPADVGLRSCQLKAGTSLSLIQDSASDYLSVCRLANNGIY